MTIDSDCVKSCWLKIRSSKGADFFVSDFYKLLFEKHPEIQQLFPEDLGQLKSKLLNMLDNVINGIDYIDELENVLIELGEQHKGTGIKEEMFDIFLSAVVDAAINSSSYSLTDKEINAWRNAFREISNIMLKAY